MIRFSIRDLIFLTLVIGMGVGWWVSNRALHLRQDAIKPERIAAIRQAHRFHVELSKAKDKLHEITVLAVQQTNRRIGHPYRDWQATITISSDVDWTVLEERIPNP